MTTVTLHFTPEEQAILLKDYKIVEVEEEINIYQNRFQKFKKIVAIDGDKREFTIEQAVNREIIKRIIHV
jgi:hypothetical protein